MTGGVCDIDKEQLATRAVIVRNGDREMELELCEYHYNQLKEQQDTPLTAKTKRNAAKLSQENFDSFVSQLEYTPDHQDRQNKLRRQMSNQTKDIVQQAAETAVRFGRRIIDTEHLLHAMADNGAVHQLLQDSQFQDGEIKSYIETHAPRTDRQAKPYDPIEITVSSRVKQAVDSALQASDDLGHNYIGPEHLLIGLAQESRGLAGKILRQHGLTHQAIRQKARTGNRK